METRPGYVAVGGIILALTVGVLAFVIWFGTGGQRQETRTYRIYFSGSVVGLQTGNPVRYRGVPVGRVTGIEIVPENVGYIGVIVEIAAGTPIVAGNVASLNLAGVTGGVYVEITGGTQGSPPLAAVAPGEPPVIPSAPSPLQQVLLTTPELTDLAAEVLIRAGQVLSEENRRIAAAIRGDIERLNGALAGRSDAAARLAARARSVSAELDGLLAEAGAETMALRSAIGDTAATLDRQAEAARADLGRLSSAYAAAVAQAGRLVAENRPYIRQFTAMGLSQVSLLTGELDALTSALSRIASRLDRSPAEFLFGDIDRGVRVPGLPR